MAGYSFGKINLPGPPGTYVYISVNGVDTAGEAIGNYGDGVDGAPTGIDVPRWSLSQPI
jgi:hypothetical protein